ncbi:hypothetical protein J31TS4_33670 [Paenibacillus sp. J31TS4]|uniref:hypothetical protein n=1 Tax=Paenibacillus sp. J31TS4 TaxID=2807195 RepID=UPI001B27BB65|nr:hypothetical protein [Paenibacillus sp. J31TS4]GIP40087.1 hypothetical protein J31TS4_33670 [Paenibacillus sp. J31TS4]
MKVTPASRLTLRPLVIHEKRKHYIVEEPASGEFYEMPQVCIDAIERIRAGETLEEAEGELKQAYPDEEVDMLAFADQLLELELVAEVDGASVGATVPAAESRRADSSRREEGAAGGGAGALGRLLFHRRLLPVYALLAAANVLLFVLVPALRPHYRDPAVFPSMTANTLLWLALTLGILLFHEWGHLLAVRAEGLSSRLGIGHRLFLVVFEMDMTGVWRLPARRRYVPFLGGLCFDMLLLFAIQTVRLFWGEAFPLADNILGAAVYAILLTVFYQALFYMKTDLYYVIENATGVYNLMETSRSWLARRLRRAGAGEVIFEGEERIVRRYAWFYLAGVALSLLIGLFYLLPVLVYMVAVSVPKLAEPPGSLGFWDAVVFLAELVLMGALLLYSWTRGRAEARHGRDRAA